MLKKTPMDPKNPGLAEPLELEVLQTSSLKRKAELFRILQSVCPSPQLPEV